MELVVIGLGDVVVILEGYGPNKDGKGEAVGAIGFGPKCVYEEGWVCEYIGQPMGWSGTGPNKDGKLEQA